MHARRHIYLYLLCLSYLLLLPLSHSRLAAKFLAGFVAFPPLSPVSISSGPGLLHQLLHQYTAVTAFFLLCSLPIHPSNYIYILAASAVVLTSAYTLSALGRF